MQVARLCVRGSLVNFTSRNLNRDQSINVDQITKRLIDKPEIIPHKSEFKKQLARTIKGEYRDLPDAAETEFWIAAWRAVLSVTYHTPLEYRAYGSVLINGKKSRKRGIVYDNTVIEIGDISILVDESLPIPPEHAIHICAPGYTKSIVINDRGLLSNPNDQTKFTISRGNRTIFGPTKPAHGSHRLIFQGEFGTFDKTWVKNGDIVKILSGPDSGEELLVTRATPSSIRLSYGPRPVVIGSDRHMMEFGYGKLQDKFTALQGKPHYIVVPGIDPIHLIIRTKMPNLSVIFDDEQMLKLVKTYGWEFFGQILKENKRPMTKITRIVKGEAHNVAMQLITSILQNSKDSIKFEIDNNLIKTETNLLSRSLTIKIAEIKREFLDHNVSVKAVENEGIYIYSNGEQPIISKKIVETRLNQTRSFDEPHSGDSEKTVRDVLESQIADKDMLSANFNSLLSRDAMRTLLEKLPDLAIKYIAVKVDPPSDFKKTYGSNPKKADIADYLGVSANQIKRYESMIKIQMLALGMGPDSPQM